MSILSAVKKTTKPLFPRKLDNSILDKLVKFIDTDTENVKFIKTEVSGRSEDSEPPSIYSNNDDRRCQWKNSSSLYWESELML